MSRLATVCTRVLSGARFHPGISFVHFKRALAFYRSSFFPLRNACAGRWEIAVVTYVLFEHCLLIQINASSIDLALTKRIPVLLRTLTNHCCMGHEPETNTWIRNINTNSSFTISPTINWENSNLNDFQKMASIQIYNNLINLHLQYTFFIHNGISMATFCHQSIF